MHMIYKNAKNLLENQTKGALESRLAKVFL